MHLNVTYMQVQVKTFVARIYCDNPKIPHGLKLQVLTLTLTFSKDKSVSTLLVTTR